MCIAPSTKARRLACLTTASYLAALCLPFFNSQHRSQAYAVYIYVSLVLSTAVTPPTSLSSDNFMLLSASQPSCLAACAIQAYWAEERQFGSTQLPADRRYSSHCQSFRDSFFFFLTNKARVPRCGMRSRFRT